jgi:ABC-type spermidine/putrescine transport system permease subunit I
MNQHLRKYFFKIVIPPNILLLIFETYKEFYVPENQVLYTAPRALSAAVFVLCATMAFGLPLLYRSYFAHNHKEKTSITPHVFMKFQKNLLLLSLSAVYFAVIGYSINMAGFFKYGCVLFALYAGYYYYPSDRRLHSEKRIFRISEKEKI